MKDYQDLYHGVIEVLTNLISIPSISGEEDQTANLLQQFLEDNNQRVFRKFNNVWVISENCHRDAPTLMLNSHHDTVKASGNWSYDPCSPEVSNGKLYGLGSNDAGGSVAALLATFLYLSKQPSLPYRLILAITAEEEISGAKGISSIIEELPPIQLAIVGEPTEMQMAVAEKGLVVIDCVAKGKAGHAAREEGINAIYEAMDDIDLIKNYRFSKKSDLLGSVKMSVTEMRGGHQHNVVPADCKFVVDVRTNEHYSNQQIVDWFHENIKANSTARSVRLNSSGISLDHPVVERGRSLGLGYFGSPTLSDQALLSCNSIKIGPGKSSRSHTADEYILLSEINDGIGTYIKLLTDLNI